MLNFFSFFAALGFFLIFPYSVCYSSNFPVVGSVRLRVDFWKKVYTEITTQEAFIHDSEDQSIIYKKVSLPQGKRERRKFIKNEKRKLQKLILAIAKDKTKNLDKEGKRIQAMIGDKSAKQLQLMSRRLRFQYGLRDRYYKGLIRSYKYMDFIKKTFKELNLPEELVYLPHVESSFNYKAYSKVGAAGIWQFMRSTARLYGLKINYIIDERRDPIKATKAAARLLRDNYKKLQSWPLALTAYNHGAQSMLRAKKRLGTSDINTIIDSYNGSRFGFASKNFYATFMATVEISQKPELYFKTFTKPAKFEYSVIKLNRAYSLRQIKQALNLDDSTLKEYNFEIRESTYRSSLFLPKGFVLKIPKVKSDKLASLQQNLIQIKKIQIEEDMEQLHIISRGETLYDISQIYKVDMNKIVAYNDIINPSRLFPGMKLRIPGMKAKIPIVPIQNKVSKTSVEVATFSQGNQQDKEFFKSRTDFLGQTVSKVSLSNKSKDILLKQTYVAQLPPINLDKYQLDIKKIARHLYRITIDTEETLGHYADWGLIKMNSIRRANGKSWRNHIIMGKKILLPILDKNINRFKEQRNEYHLSNQEDFFNSYSIQAVKKYKLKRGDTVNNLLHFFDLPFWLLRQYQKGNFNPNQIKVGDVLNIPETLKIDEDSSLIPQEKDE